jgi:hypothetical protein
LNQYLHLSDGELHRSRLESVAVQCGPVTNKLTVEMGIYRGRLRTTYLLHTGLEQLDIVNELTREASSEPQCTWFAFPFAVADRQYHYDGPGAVLRPGLRTEGGDLLPGAGRACIALQSFLAASNDDVTVLLATPEAHLVQLGAQALTDPLADSDSRHPLALSLVAHNLTRNDHAVSQGGQTNFQFRYSLTAYPGAFHAAQAVRFGQGVAMPMPAAWMSGPVEPRFTAPNAAFVIIEPENVIMTGLAVAPDGQGRILRLWECDGRDTEAVVTLRGLAATHAWRCDLLGARQEALHLNESVVHLPIPASGLRALSFE